MPRGWKKHGKRQKIPLGTALKLKKTWPVNWETILAGITGGNTAVEYGAKRKVFWQGQPADSVFYVRHGKVKISVTSKQGKEAIVSVLSAGDFFGEACPAGQQLRIAAASAMSDCTLIRIEQPVMTRILHEQQGVSELFVSHLLSRNIRYEAEDRKSTRLNS